MHLPLPAARPEEIGTLHHFGLAGCVVPVAVGTPRSEKLKTRDVSKFCGRRRCSEGSAYVCPHNMYSLYRNCREICQPSRVDLGKRAPPLGNTPAIDGSRVATLRRHSTDDRNRGCHLEQ